MALINCSECGGQVSTAATACPKCGAPTKPKSQFWKVTLISLLLLVVTFVVFAFIRGSDPQVQARWQDREAYESCMDSWRASLANPQIKQVCEHRRQAFIAKYQREP